MARELERDLREHPSDPRHALFIVGYLHAPKHVSQPGDIPFASRGPAGRRQHPTRGGALVRRHSPGRLPPTAKLAHLSFSGHRVLGAQRCAGLDALDLCALSHEPDCRSPAWRGLPRTRRSAGAALQGATTGSFHTGRHLAFRVARQLRSLGGAGRSRLALVRTMTDRSHPPLFPQNRGRARTDAHL